ncbi:MAG: polysaccharide biosynthesis tyrosine autokinase [Scytonematopsis contorta HA4267-MV1]|jgi:capsular exopolysaccharide synthesis family protein|nr:polysaccharide biosynthesis tyrosine autokinase [Scytonematopsis contorta HA4267-MV1]
MEEKESSFSLMRYWLILKRRWLPGLAVFPPIFMLVFIALSAKKPVFIAEGTLRFQKVNTTSSLTGVGKELGDLTPLAEKTNPLSTEAEVIRSYDVVEKTITTLNLRNEETDEPLKAQDFLSNLNVNEIQKTDVLKLSYQHTNPKLAAQVVNTLMAVYLEHNVSSQRATVRAVRKFLEKQLPQAELQVRKLEVEMREFKEKNKIVAIENEASKAVEIITDLQKRIGEIKSRIADVDAQFKSIRSKVGVDTEQAVLVTTLSQSSGVQDILKEIQQVESDLASKRTKLLDIHPEIISLEQRSERLKTILQQRIEEVSPNQRIKLNSKLQQGQLQQELSAELVKLESTRMGLAGELFTLGNLERTHRQRLRNLPSLEQQQRQLERKLQAAQSTYSLLLQRLQETRIAENQNVGNVGIISKAQAPEAPSVSPSNAYYAAALVSLLGSLGLMYLLEVRDKSVKTVEEARDLLGLTLLGIIPSFSKPKISIGNNQGSELIPKLVVRDAPRSPMSEAYRMLRANLKFMSADKELKVIVVTSSVPKEGKSTVAANLAVAMAQMERKVLLVDGDLHRPIQHKIWEQNNTNGLSNVIVGQIEIMKAIKKVMDNLDILTAGAVPPSPASLLDSKRMASLVESFASYYDFVIIDAPSLNLAADAATLGQMADGVLLVVRPGIVDSVNATLARELLEKSGQNVLGYVVNAVNTQNEQQMKYYFEEEYNTNESSRDTVVVKPTNSFF